MSYRNNRGFRVWSHHDMDAINEIRANRTVNDSMQSVISGLLGLGCLIGCYYTAGPVDKTAPFVFYILRTIFGENTCVGFFILAIIFGLICKASGAHIDPYKNSTNRNHEQH